MATARPTSSRCVQREDPSGSTDSSVTPRTPVPTASPELLASPGQVAEPPGRTVWEQTCAEYEANLPPFPEEHKMKQEARAEVSTLEELTSQSLNTEHYLKVPMSPVSCPQKKSQTIEPKTYIYKVATYLSISAGQRRPLSMVPSRLASLSDQLSSGLRQPNLMERKITKFIACDFLSEWLYNHNPKRIGEPFTEFFSIPFVEEWLKHHPRPPIPLSLLLTEEEAALLIQSFWRAYLVRCDPEIQELRKWQKKLREDKHIRQRVKVFWTKQEQKVKCKMEDK